jgi:ABC-2 type transport system permease protein
MSSQDSAIILDRGYRNYHGPRTGRRGAMRAIVKEGYRRVLGLRRKAKRKLFPWTLIALALGSVAVLVAIEWVSSSLPVTLDTSELFPRYAGYFDFISYVALLFAAFTGPQLLIPDRTQGVLNIYFSRPLGVRDYLVAKGGTFAAVILSFWLVPQILLHLGYAALSPAGFLSYLGETTDILWKVPVAALVYFSLHSSLAFLAASFAKRVGTAAAGFVAVLLGLNLVAALFREASSASGARWTSLLALEQHPRYVRDWIFDLDSSTLIPAQAGFGPEASFMVVLGLTVISVLLVGWRYRRLT